MHLQWWWEIVAEIKWKQMTFIWMLESNSSYCAIHKSTHCRQVVRLNACEDGGWPYNTEPSFVYRRWSTNPAIFNPNKCCFWFTERKKKKNTKYFFLNIIIILLKSFMRKQSIQFYLVGTFWILPVCQGHWNSRWWQFNAGHGGVEFSMILFLLPSK